MKDNNMACSEGPTETKTKRHHIEHWKKMALYLIIYDMAAIYFWCFGAFLENNKSIKFIIPDKETAGHRIWEISYV